MKKSVSTVRSLARFPVAAGLALAAGAAFAGPLNPPVGPVTSTYKTMTEVEPRVAVNAANTPGDNDGSPSVFKITQPGSYYLTGNITGVAGKIGVEIASHNVTLDLNGFTIQGGLAGVHAPVLNGITIRNGVISGVSEMGVRGMNSLGMRVERVTVLTSGGIGIDAGHAATIENCTVSAASYGFRFGDGAQARGCIARGCQQGYNADNCTGVSFDGCTAIACTNYGFAAPLSHGVRLDRCTAAQIGTGNGYWLGDEATLTNSTAMDCGSHGIAAGANCVIVGNLSQGHGSTGVSADGIVVGGAGTLVQGNRCIGSTSNGVSVQSGVADVVVIGNWARGNAGGNFNVPAGNELGPIITNPGASSFSGATAFSNFSY